MGFVSGLQEHLKGSPVIFALLFAVVVGLGICLLVLASKESGTTAEGLNGFGAIALIVGVLGLGGVALAHHKGVAGRGAEEAFV